MLATVRRSTSSVTSTMANYRAQASTGYFLTLLLVISVTSFVFGSDKVSRIQGAVLQDDRVLTSNCIDRPDSEYCIMLLKSDDASGGDGERLHEKTFNRHEELCNGQVTMIDNMIANDNTMRIDETLTKENGINGYSARKLQEGTRMTLLINGTLFNPKPVGRRNVLLAGKHIAAIFRDEDFPWVNLSGLSVEVIDVKGGLIAPGLIDIHVHLTGGGGEMGPSSRTPEASLSELLNGGITSAVGILGTDCVSRSLENLLTKSKALQAQGLTIFMWSGCYQMPSLTLTGSLARDMQLISEVIGAGEIAISDHRSSWPSTQDLLQLVSDARVGGMLSGKAGIVHFHVGSATSYLDPLWEVLNASKWVIPITQMLPTHISSRGATLVREAEVWLQSGGHVDLTSDQEGEHASYDVLLNWKSRDIPLGSISISSDGFGSLPVFDSKGELTDYAVASPVANLATIRRLVQQGNWSLEDALQLSTSNPARFLSFSCKGTLKVGCDGDLIVLDKITLDLKYVFSMGEVMKTPSWTKKGMFDT